ncbi:class I fructose-bisphosphate aldolase [Microbacterium sp.]|uniref:class I fructose-bisphosphate aldolase n=1 Tax=Microbacterium sp. TaxID=51671 RepID=UPI002736F379|nr:class I fructose-bisphosphate aldolase [Microbacterium sp.]MDP3949774.1 class I fructose-bisphosphate aldolase [Microbacterium sp.]
MRGIQDTIAAIFSPPKGMMVADEYAEALSTRRTGDVPALIDAALETPGLEDYVSAVLLTHETFAAGAQRADGLPADNLLVGVRLTPPGSPSDSVRKTVVGLIDNGAAFVEWRANRAPPDVPRGSPHIDAAALALGASIAQAEGMLPIVTVAMPDLATHSISVSEAVTTNALIALREQLTQAEVDSRGLVIRVNMVVPGLNNPSQADPLLIAHTTLRVLERALPEELSGVLLLSGGQPLATACTNLAAITSLARERSVPWQLSFGFSRALFDAAAEVLQHPAFDPDEPRDQLLRACRRASASLAGGATPGTA